MFYLVNAYNMVYNKVIENITLIQEGSTMIIFVLGALLVGIIGVFIMSLMVVAKRADEISEERRHIIQHP